MKTLKKILGLLFYITGILLLVKFLLHASFPACTPESRGVCLAVVLPWWATLPGSLVFLGGSTVSFVIGKVLRK